MAQYFNEHVCNMLKTIEKVILPSKTTFNDYLKNHSANTFFINPGTTD